MFRHILLLIVLLSVAACGPSDSGSGTADDAGGVAAVLVPTMGVQVQGDTVEFQLQVANAADTAVVLEFTTSQRYDFEVTTEAGEVVWQWSSDRMFGQALGQETIAPGRTLVYRETWVAPAGSGRLQARGRVVSSSHPLELETSFEVGG
jgi:hypothetical protein